MKKLFNLKIYVVVFAICVIFLTRAQVAAATTKLLEFNGYTIYEDTTADEISEIFGTPKATGISAFGGYSYSWCDDDYTYFLHIETNSENVIKGYGCINGDFVGSVHSQGDTDDGTYYTLSGTTVVGRYDDLLFGMYEYNCTYSESVAFLQEFADSSDYLYDLQKHTILVSKVLAKMHNFPFTQEAVSEEIFYANENLKANGTDLRTYGEDNGKNQYLYCISYGTEDFYSDLPNPIRLGKITEYYYYDDNYKYILYDLDVNIGTRITAVKSVIYIDPDYLEEKANVELTLEELDLLERVKEQYEEYNKNGNSIEKNYDIEPVYDSLPLVAGKWTDEALLTATSYLNIARAGLGLGLLELDYDLADCAQHKAALVYYLNNVEGLDVSHSFSKPDYIDDDFYNKAQTCLNENLFTGNIITSIVWALSDAYGDKVACGHRYNLLEPSYTIWGVGAVGSGISWGWQGCHKLSGYTSYTNELVAWPSNGIFPIDLAYNGIGNWTAKFYKNYSVTSDTEVLIKCLNNGKEYSITNENVDGVNKILEVVSSSQITFRDDSISYESGDVFEITLKNVTDRNTQQTTDYTYRSVFLALYQIGAVSVEDVEVDKSDIKLLIGQEEKINTTIMPEDATNKYVVFSSSNDNVVSVRQDGKIYANAQGTAVITIKSKDTSNIIKTVSVTVKKNADDPDYIKGDLNSDLLVNADDAAIALDLYKYNNATEFDLLVGDMNGDNLINADDAALIIDVYKYGK